MTRLMTCEVRGIEEREERGEREIEGREGRRRRVEKKRGEKKKTVTESIFKSQRYIIANKSTSIIPMTNVTMMAVPGWMRKKRVMTKTTTRT